jgi:hypothetical protein
MMTDMQFTVHKAVAATLWVTALSASGILGGVRSPSSWLLLGGIAVVPALVMIGRMNGPTKSMSESIGEVLR